MAAKGLDNDNASSKQPITNEDELANLTARATSEYAHKRYTSAAESYSKAVELQAEMNGEMATQNADLLYAYGRCLYKAAVEKSDVLGGKVGESSKPDASDAGKKRKAEDSEGPSRKKVKKEEPPEDQGNLQFEGDDEDWLDADDEEAEGDPQLEEEADDDFAIAYEILELARVLFEKKLQALIADDSAEDDSAGIARSLKESLADIHDLQGEIHLENEQFHLAVEDERASLKYKDELHPVESALIAEAHFKLSLSLEFASKTLKVEPDTAPDTAAPSYTAHHDAKPDAKGMEEAALHMEAAIKSTRQRLEKEEGSMVSLTSSPAKLAAKRRQAAETKEMITEMEERVSGPMIWYDRSR